MTMTWRTRAVFALAGCALLTGASCRRLQNYSCDISRRISLRAEWQAEPCKKLAFELWTHMKAEGSAQHAEAQYVRENCLNNMDVELTELTTPEGYTVSEALDAAPGEVVSETTHATTYMGATAETFEAFCADENILKVTGVKAHLDSYRSASRRPERRLQTSTSEGVQAHQVPELIAGLKNLGCSRTTGEDQTVCVMSDSFDARFYASDLRDSGDLPEVEILKDYVYGVDEGSAMIEVMYDIASGSTYKFNTATMGEQTFADDIEMLATKEDCDVIVDDIKYYEEPAFSDGVISVAVDEAINLGSLYFTSGGNNGFGYRFTSNFECTDLFNSDFQATLACGDGAASHVFQPKATDRTRFWYPYNPTFRKEYLEFHWDADVADGGDIVIVVWAEDGSTGEVYMFDFFDNYAGDFTLEMMSFKPILLDDEETVDPDVKYYLQMVHYQPDVDDIKAEFLLASSEGLSGESDGSIRGHTCASKIIAVAAMDWAEGDLAGGGFEDPETSPVESYSSRGPCIVNGETRSKPTTTAADRVSTSTISFKTFKGTSAAAPAAAAIATIIRAACFPKVVGYDEMMEMLTDYKYTIDYTNDAGGASETWGTEAGHGIISASQMLRWVESNCPESCSVRACLTPGSGDYRCSYEGTSTLNLDYCGITDSDVDDGRLRACFTAFGVNNIELLDLSNNGLTTLPRGYFQGLGSMTELNLKYNKLTTLHPKVLNGLRKLTTMSLKGNHLQCSPMLPQNLKSIEVDDSITGIECVNVNPCLQPGNNGYRCTYEGKSTLNLNGCGMVFADDLDGWLHACFNEFGPGNIKTLALKNNQLSSLPFNILDGLEALTTLNLKNNKLVCRPRLPETVSTLTIDDGAQDECDPCTEYNGLLWWSSERTATCCAMTCGICKAGSSYCYTAPGGEKDCCPWEVNKGYNLCSATNPAPCKVWFG